MREEEDRRVGWFDRFKRRGAPRSPTALRGVPADDTGANADIARALDRVYGHSGVGFAVESPDDIARYVALYPATDHIVYVTFGAHRHRFPHEFVMRIRYAAPPEGEALWEAAPAWPVRALREIARVEPKMPHPFAPGNHLSNMEVHGEVLAYRHFAFVTDPVLPRVTLERTGQPLVFVQAVPLTDAQEAAIAAIPAGERNTVLADQAERDPLFRVEDR